MDEVDGWMRWMDERGGWMDEVDRWMRWMDEVGRRMDEVDEVDKVDG